MKVRIFETKKCDICKKPIALILQFDDGKKYTYEEVSLESRFVDDWNNKRDFCKECIERENKEIEDMKEFEKHFHSKLDEFFANDDYEILDENFSFSWHGKKLSIPVFPETFGLCEQFIADTIEIMEQMKAESFEMMERGK